MEMIVDTVRFNKLVGGAGHGEKYHTFSDVFDFPLYVQSTTSRVCTVRYRKETIAYTDEYRQTAVEFFTCDTKPEQVYEEARAIYLDNPEEHTMLECIVRVLNKERPNGINYRFIKGRCHKTRRQFYIRQADLIAYPLLKAALAEAYYFSEGRMWFHVWYVWLPHLKRNRTTYLVDKKCNF